MEQTSLSMVFAIRSTTLSSLDCALPRPAMISCKPVRISRAEAAALSGIAKRYQMRRAYVTRLRRRLVGPELVERIDGRLRIGFHLDLLPEQVDHLGQFANVGDVVALHV